MDWKATFSDDTTRSATAPSVGAAYLLALNYATPRGLAIVSIVWVGPDAPLRAALRVSAKAKLLVLGFTEAEIALMFGGQP